METTVNPSQGDTACPPRSAGEASGDTGASQQIQLRDAFSDWTGAANELLSDYVDLAMFELRTAADALSVFVALTIVAAFFLASLWVSGFALAGSIVLHAADSTSIIIGLVFAASASGAAVCLGLRRAIRQKIMVSFPPKSSDINNEREQANAV